MEMWHKQKVFTAAIDRQAKLRRFINFYNIVKPHKILNGTTLYEIIEFHLNKNV